MELALLLEHLLGADAQRGQLGQIADRRAGRLGIGKAAPAAHQGAEVVAVAQQEVGDDRRVAALVGDVVLVERSQSGAWNPFSMQAPVSSAAPIRSDTREGQQ